MDNMSDEFDWDERYRAKTARWDKGATVPALEDWLSNNPTREGRVAVPGCGYGHEAAAMARAWPAAEVVGIDLSETAIQEAGKNYQLPNLRFEIGDFFADPVEGDLTAIIEHTCFCAIPPQDRKLYRDTCIRRLETGGLLIAVFYLNPIETEDEPDEGPPWGASVPELNNYFEADFERLISEVPRSAFPGREMRELLRIYRKK